MKGVESVWYVLQRSKNRANEVKFYLVAKGIAPNRVACVGYGSSRPISKDTTESGMEMNRRVSLFRRIKKVLI